MKTIIKNSIISAAIVMAIISANSCRKKTITSAPTKTPTEEKGILYIHVHTNIATVEVDSGVVSADANGRRFQLDTAQFYISNIKLKKLDGTYISAGSAYLLKNIEQESYMVGNVPAGNYLSASFDIGIDAATNQTNPSSYAITSPLSVQDPSMWFGSTSQGYMFVNVTGLADTTAGNNGNVDYRFSYQLGTSSMLKTVTLPDEAFTVSPGTTPSYIHLIADYGVLLHGINFKTQNIATPWVNSAVAGQIANNIPAMFKYEY